jgi:hypothetical protein
MSGCPDIDALLKAGAEGRKALDEHAAGCQACAAVLALEASRKAPGGDGGPPQAPDASSPPADGASPPAPSLRDECAEAMADIAALPEGLLDHRSRRWLSRHIEGCAKCRETAYRMAFFDDHPGDVPTLVLDPNAWKRPPPPRPRKPRRRAFVLAMVGAVVVAAAAGAIAVRWLGPRVTPIERSD